MDALFAKELKPTAASDISKAASIKRRHGLNYFYLALLVLN
jgi:hypothetical protein